MQPTQAEPPVIPRDVWAKALRHRWLVVKIARRLLPLASRRGFDLDDLTHEGLIGVCVALRGYRPDAGRWTTYAGKCVRSALIEAIYRGNLVRIPRRRALKEGIGEPFRDGAARPDRIPLIDRVPWSDVTAALDQLSTNGREILLSHHGIGRPAREIRDIAAALGLSRRRTFEIQKAALDQLRVALAIHD